MLFILAFSITMIMFAQCRSTADVVITNLQLNNFMRGVNGSEDNITRRVGLETVIPTIYRYSNQDTALRVVIQNREGKDIQVFDTAIETAVQSQEGKGEPYYENYIKPNFCESQKPTYMYEAPWANNKAKTLERINCYITGQKPNLLRNSELGETGGYNTNYLLSYGDVPYLETYVEYRTSGTILIDKYGEEIVTQQPSGTFKIITYRQQN